MTKKKIQSVPTNIITGFLGSGKTSAILHLLTQKPANERWAILVNEFGEIGVDSHLIHGQAANKDEVFISEVPGGCMCCASWLPMQIALNQLLAKAQPDRLLIEPTGLGHPLEVLEVLSNQYYKDIVQLQQTITLVDARNLTNQRYTEHEIFNQQLHIADIIVGSKSDLYKHGDKILLKNHVSSQDNTTNNLVFIEHGKIRLSLLSGTTQYQIQHSAKKHHHKSSPINKPALMSEASFIKVTNKGEGFKSIGWRFSAKTIFDRPKLHQFFNKIKVLRLKAVFITSEGIFGYNIASDSFKGVELDACNESRIEIICEEIDESWEQELLSSING